jgi:signal transduction histidine kinase
MPGPLKERWPGDWFTIPPEAGPTERLEKVLATARVLLATSSLAAIFVDPTEPSRYAGVAYGLLIFYAAYSLLILLLLQLRKWAPRYTLLTHGIDMVWAAGICLFTEGPNSPFFLFFVFVLFAAAYRWRLPETVASATLMVVLLISEAALVTYGPATIRLEAEYEMNRFIMRAAYLMILAFLLGYLAQEEKQLRAEGAASARLLAKGRVDLGLRATLQAELDELLRIFQSPQAQLLVEEAGSGRFFLWQAERKPATGESLLYVKELDSVPPHFLAFPEGAAWHGLRLSPRAGRAEWDCIGLDDRGNKLQPPPRLANGFLAQTSCRSFLAASIDFGKEFTGRLFLLDPGRRRERESDLHFLQMLVRNAGPVVYNVYLLRRLRSRAGAMERARVARELHDGAIQSLIAVEMQVDVLRKQAEAASQPLAHELEHIQQLLRDEVQALRELIQQMKPLDIAPRQLLEFLAVTVELFRRESGVAASFVTDLEDVPLPPRVCRELARIVQEALANVRKHSRARHAVVWFGLQNGYWKLVIDDDGRGFDFAGRLSHAELDAARRGPLVIKERVRSIGGELTIESTPGRGARLEITLPSAAPRTHA